MPEPITPEPPVTPEPEPEGPSDDALTEKVTAIVRDILSREPAAPAPAPAAGKLPTLRQQESNMEQEVLKALKALNKSEGTPAPAPATLTPEVRPGGPSWREKMWKGQG